MVYAFPICSPGITPLPPAAAASLPPRGSTARLGRSGTAARGASEHVAVPGGRGPAAAKPADGHSRRLGHVQIGGANGGGVNGATRRYAS